MTMQYLSSSPVWGDTLQALVQSVINEAPQLFSQYNSAQKTIDTTRDGVVKANAVLRQVRAAEEALKIKYNLEKRETGEVITDVSKFGLVLGVGIIGFAVFQIMEKKKKR